MPFPGLLDSLVMVPLALPGIVLAFGYVVTYTDTALDPLNNPVPLLDIAYAIPAIALHGEVGCCWSSTNQSVVGRGISTFGASRFHTLRKSTVPLLMANLIAGSLLCASLTQCWMSLTP